MDQRNEFYLHLSTPPGEGGVAVFDLYGDGAEAVLKRLLPWTRLPRQGRSRLGNLVDQRGDPLDEVVVSRRSSEASWCRLPAWTVSAHGGSWIQQRLREVLVSSGGKCLGRREVLELSVRAGGLDAVQAAAYEQMVDACTERAAAFFLRQYSGELSRELKDCLRRLDEEQAATRKEAASEVARRVGVLLAGAESAYRLGHPLRVLLAGRPNTGKSTLFNRLVERERVVVSKSAGTTRDLVRETTAIGGFPVTIADSAGLRSLAADPVESSALRRLREATVDAVLYLLAPPWRLGAEEEHFLARFAADRRLLIANFSDLGTPGPGSSAVDLRLSALTGAHMNELKRSMVERWLGSWEAAGSDPVAPFTTPQRDALEAVSAAFKSGESSALDGMRQGLIICLRNSLHPERGAMTSQARPFRGRRSDLGDGGRDGSDVLQGSETGASSMEKHQKLIEAPEFEGIYGAWSAKIREALDPRENWALVGIKRRGAVLARRLHGDMQAKWKELPYGEVDISLYRDDYHLRPSNPRVLGTEMSFAVDDTSILLVDDVLFSGRTVTAAVKLILDFGRPRRIWLAVFIDRGHRELPIAAHFTGREIQTQKEDHVFVLLKGMGDAEDAVDLITGGGAGSVASSTTL